MNDQWRELDSQNLSEKSKQRIQDVINNLDYNLTLEMEWMITVNHAWRRHLDKQI